MITTKQQQECPIGYLAVEYCRNLNWFIFKGLLVCLT